MDLFDEETQFFRRKIRYKKIFLFFITGKNFIFEKIKKNLFLLFLRKTKKNTSPFLSHFSLISSFKQKGGFLTKIFFTRQLNNISRPKELSLDAYRIFLFEMTERQPKTMNNLNSGVSSILKF